MSTFEISVSVDLTLFFSLFVIVTLFAFTILLTDVIRVLVILNVLAVKIRKVKCWREKIIVRTSATHRFNVMLGCYYKKNVIDIFC